MCRQTGRARGRVGVGRSTGDGPTRWVRVGVVDTVLLVCLDPTPGGRRLHPGTSQYFRSWGGTLEIEETGSREPPDHRGLYYPVSLSTSYHGHEAIPRCRFSLPPSRQSTNEYNIYTNVSSPSGTDYPLYRWFDYYRRVP